MKKILTNLNEITKTIRTIIKLSVFAFVLIGILPLAVSAVPSIDIQKFISVDDKVTWDNSPSGGPYVLAGNNVYYKLLITNDGTDVLTNIKLSDSLYSVSNCVITDPLNPSTSFECVIGPFPSDKGTIWNGATVTGESNGITYTDIDFAVYFGYIPCVDITKTGPVDAKPGETITYHFRVENCGNIALRGGVDVYDPLFGIGPIVPNFELYPIGSIGYDSIKEFDKTFVLPNDICGPFVNTATAIGHPWGINIPTSDSSTWTINIVCAAPPGTGTPGYWMNHPDAWPVDSITVGEVTYSKEDAIAMIARSVKDDKTLTMFPALVSAKLNVLIGNPSGCIDETITNADNWMKMYGPVGSSILAKSPAWKIGEPLYIKLDAYNNGLLCAVHRD